MAEKKQTIVIKKITVVAGGGHGGSWKVALADFMTALMAFFLVMWLLGQSDETKKAVSDYFSTPSVIEYNFQNFGAEVTLEKLFLDLINEPLKAFQQFIEPATKSPNLLDMGSAKVVTAFLADQMNDYAKNVQISPDGFDFDIPDTVLFERGTSNPLKTFVEIMDKIKGVTTGLQDAEIKVTSGLFVQAVPGASASVANRISAERLDLVINKIRAGLEFNSVAVKGFSSVKEKRGEVDPQKLIGFIRISVKQKDATANGKKPRKLETIFSDPSTSMSVYESLSKQAGERRQGSGEVDGRRVGDQFGDKSGGKAGERARERARERAGNKSATKFGQVESLKNPVIEEMEKRALEGLPESAPSTEE